MAIRLILGLAMTAVAGWLAGRRLRMLYRLGRAAQPVEPGRTDGRRDRARAELSEVLGQRKVLRWTVPGLAHAVVFWAFIVLSLTLVEGYGALFQRDFAIPVIGTRPWLGFAEDLFAVLTLIAVATFTVIRLRQSPARRGRSSRFFGSHLDAAWLVLFMIFNVVWSLLLYRGAQINTGHFPYAEGAFASEATATLLEPLGRDVNDVLETAGLLVALGIVLGFGVLVVHSKHLHILTAPANVALARRPRALGALLPVYSGARPVDFDDPGEDDTLGRGTIADFTWKGLLDFATCTECGRCQSQCPAWQTGKPLSPKALIMALRDHTLASAPYLLARPDDRAGLPERDRVAGERPLSGDGGVIDPDALWSCTTCGACVQQCPVDIEHVDHIVDMRRYQLLMESSFPAEAGVMLRNLEHAGDPWGRGAGARLRWTDGLPFDVPVLDPTTSGGNGGGKTTSGGDGEPEYLFWVGCAGALDERAQQTTRAVAELLHTAGVRFAVLGEAESCTGDPARRIGHEFLFEMLARQAIETLDGVGARHVVTTCAHCFNTLANEYPRLGGHYRVLHHTQLLATLLADGRLTPVRPVDGTVAYHDPCYLGRHNRVFAPPRQLLGGVAGVRLAEAPRSRERSFCCGAGGARMWMDERLGTRINEARAEELLGTGPDVITAGCPYCVAMLSDGVAASAQRGGPGAGVAVTDVADVLLRAVRPDHPDQPGQAGGPDHAGRPDHPDQPGQAGGPDQPGQAGGPDHAGRTTRPDQHGTRPIDSDPKGVRR